MKTRKTKRFGPFSYHRIKEQDTNFISAYITKYPNSRCGWEWGTDNSCVFDTSICIRISGLNVFSFESFTQGGFLIQFMGFWYMS
jgi:hypothetical protein